MVNYLVDVLQVKQQTEQTRKGHGTDKRPTFFFHNSEQKLEDKERHAIHFTIKKIRNLWTLRITQEMNALKLITYRKIHLLLLS